MNSPSTTCWCDSPTGRWPACAHQWTVIDALDGGAVSGEMGPLAALDGIVESPEYRDAELATGPHMLALAALGELDADSTYRTALEGLVAATRWS